MTTNASDGPIDPDLVLSEHTLNALKEFYCETYSSLNSDGINEKNGYIEENWQLSQFWYTEDTADYLSHQVIHALDLQIDGNTEDKTSETKRIACISCPTLFDNLYKKLNKVENNSIVLVLFEFDRRFQSKYPSNYVFYDYNQPIDQSLRNSFKEKSFDAVIADPPFLSEECIRKTSETIKYLSKDKVLVCSGAITKPWIEQFLQLEQCLHFEPKHNRKLGNEFKCFSNFRLKY